MVLRAGLDVSEKTVSLASIGILVGSWFKKRFFPILVSVYLCSVPIVADERPKCHVVLEQ